MTECKVEIIASSWRFKCHEPSVRNDVCQFHYDKGNTQELFETNLDEIVLHAIQNSEVNDETQ